MKYERAWIGHAPLLLLQRHRAKVYPPTGDALASPMRFTVDGVEGLLMWRSAL